MSMETVSAAFCLFVCFAFLVSITNFYCLIFFWKIANVPQKYEANHPLGVWVNKQRMEMKAKLEGRRTNMTDRRIDLLTTIGFEWAKPKGQAAWNEKYK